MNALVVTGTDTGIGKTVFAAMLTLALDATYWKPIQSGLDDGTDTMAVAALTGLPPARFVPEKWVLTASLSPHRSAELDGTTIDAEILELPTNLPLGQRLVVEGAGGLMVPITRQVLFIDIFQRWRAPLVLCARTELGTINHSLLSLEALRQRDIPLLGVAFIGEANPDNERTIVEFAGVKRLGRLPRLPSIDAQALRQAFASNFDLRDFDAVLAA